MKTIQLVTATRKSQQEFITHSALGRSLQLYRHQPGWNLRLFAHNRRPLPDVYNEAIDLARKDPAILVFIHDDAYLNDFYWRERVADGLAMFDVIGIAGNRRRVPAQPAWCFIDDKLTWDDRANLSGAVAHGRAFPCPISFYGPSGQACKLLDGIFLAVDSETANKSGLKFDRHFPFHFYDLDFCRQAERLGLSMGTWPISVIHESGGAFGSAQWNFSYRLYLEKYGELETAAGQLPAPVR